MQTYFAKSIFNSRTLWVNLAMFLVAILETNEVIQIIPEWAMNYFVAFATVVNVALRIFSVRPVAFVAPGETKPVEVKSL
jgi:hypothetical protein